METSNALVQSTQLGKNDHGLLTLWLNLSWEGSGAGFGGFPRTADHLGFCVERILDTVGGSRLVRVHVQRHIQQNILGPLALVVAHPDDGTDQQVTDQYLVAHRSPLPCAITGVPRQ